MVLCGVHVEAEERIEHRMFLSKVRAEVEEMFVRQISCAK
jgi:hypothetical protein